MVFNKLITCFPWHLQPHIGNKGGKQDSPNDYLSYTVSAPSGRATTLFSTDGMSLCLFESFYVCFICLYPCGMSRFM